MESGHIMKFRNEFVHIMCEVNQEYKKYVVKENGKEVLYVKILRAIYGCIESALLWYELYVKGWGFVESNELSSGSWPKQLALSANTKRSQKSTSS